MVAVTTIDSLPDRLAGELAERGLSVVDGFLGPELVTLLRRRGESLLADGRMRPARIGKGESRRLDRDQRGDLISWIDPVEPDPAEAQLLARVEEVRLALNRRLFLGLFDYEACHALYRNGARYRRHRDRFSRSGRRILTLVSYLNEGWREGDGGELRVHLPDGGIEVVAPLAGRAVVFLSDRFPHEVLPARKERRSIAGWFRSRP